jgi:excisionase family DNA binding protein
MSPNPFEIIEQKLANIEELVLSLKKEKPETATKINYLTRQEVAERLKISLPTVDIYTRKGILKGRRIGSRILFLESDLLVKEIPTLKYQR